jgi:alkanesulfonate monooxygenase SsuD/methylene tetrahydromethanopterin reductase-like flavin-dependent oxidoreductase (luciferase family)
VRLGITLRPSGGLTEAIDSAVAAENAGFQSVYVAERHFDSANGFANAFAVAAAISGRVRQTWIGVIPAIGMDHPLRLVEQANMLDLLTRGRSIMVLSEAFEPRQYAAFGVPVPRNGLFDDLVQRLEDAWSWDYQEDGPALEFTSGAYAAKMAGRVMPAASPRRAIETSTAMGVQNAAQKGWSVQLRVDDLEQVRDLVETYREVLASSGHTARTVEDTLDHLAVVHDVALGPVDTDLIRDLEGCGVAEVRLEAARGVPPQALFEAVR